MKSVYLILAHGNFQQLRRLIYRLLLSNAGVILHVDKKTAIPHEFLAEFQANFSSKVFFAEKRYSTAWGSFEAVLAALALLREAWGHFPEARYFSLISGQDYPIKSPQYLETFFEQADSSFVSHRPLRDEEWKYGNVRRINKFYWARNRKSFLGFIFRTISLPPRSFPIPLDKIFYGSQWWSMRREAVSQVMDWVDKKPEILNAFRWTYVPDEMFFQTALISFIQDKHLADNHLRHIEHFSLPRDYFRLKIIGRNGIRILGAPDLENLKRSSALFARKFDMKKDSAILDSLDECCK